jgi:hypothetical protein
VVLADGEGPVAEDDLSLDLGEDVARGGVRKPGGGAAVPFRAAVDLSGYDRAGQAVRE